MVCPSGIKEIIEFLLGDNIDIRNPLSTLAAAVAILPSNILNILIAKDADVNSQYQDGESALHAAVRVDSPTKFTLLVNHGAGLSIEWYGLNSLETAILYNCGGNIMKVIDRYLTRKSTEELISLAR